MKTLRKTKGARRRGNRSGMLVMVGIICLWLAGIGLVHVITTNNIHALGDQQRILERQISELHRDIGNTNLQIKAATTETALRERLSAQRTHLRKIRPKEIWDVSVNPALVPLAALPTHHTPSLPQ